MLQVFHCSFLHSASEAPYSQCDVDVVCTPCRYVLPLPTWAQCNLNGCSKIAFIRPGPFAAHLQLSNDCSLSHPECLLIALKSYSQVRSSVGNASRGTAPWLICRLEATIRQPSLSTATSKFVVWLFDWNSLSPPRFSSWPELVAGSCRITHQ